MLERYTEEKKKSHSDALILARKILSVDTLIFLAFFPPESSTAFFKKKILRFF